MSTNCKSCGKMMTKPEDFSGGDINSQYCSNCTNADGSLKSLDEITLHIANQLIMSQGIDREAATKAARSILSVQPEWKTTFTKRESGKALKNKILIVATCVALVATTIVVYNIFAPNPNRVYTWENNTDVGIFEAALTEKEKNIDGAQVIRYKFYGDQDVINIDSSGILEFTQNNSVFKGIAIDDRAFSIMIDNHANESGSSYVGSINTSKTLITPDRSRFDFKGLHTFWTEYIDGDYILHVDVNFVTRRIGYLTWSSQVVFCGKFAVWIEENGNPQISKVMAYNTESEKVLQISSTATGKAYIRAGKTCVYWIDSGDQTKAGLTINGFDLATMKPITTGIITGTKKYLESHGLGKLSAMAKEGKMATWTVVGDDIVYEGLTNDGKIRIFEKNSGIIETFSNNGCLPFFIKTIWLADEPKSFQDNIFIEPDQSLYSDNDKNAVNPYICWVSDIVDKQYSLSFKRIGDREIKTITRFEISKPLGVTGQWFVYLADVKDDDKKTEICTLNLADGKKISLGPYAINGVMPRQFYNPGFVLNDRFLAWSALTKDSDYDIFYTRLP